MTVNARADISVQQLAAEREQAAAKLEAVEAVEPPLAVTAAMPTGQPETADDADARLERARAEHQRIMRRVAAGGLP